MHQTHITTRRPARLSRRLGAAVVAAAGAASVLVALASPAGAVVAPNRIQRLTSAQAAALHSDLRAVKLSGATSSMQLCRTAKLRCDLEVITSRKTAAKSAPAILTSAAAPKSSGVHPNAIAPPVGYGADELSTAYGLDSAPSRTGTIVVIGAGAYPTLESDLSIYRSTYGLPACTKSSGCFKQINYKGGAPYAPATDPDDQFGEEDIAVETALDVDMASASCPKCKIVSMQVPLADGFYGDEQATHHAILHFATGVQTARKLGASAVSISYGYPTDSYADSGTIAKLMTQPGMPIVSSSGDSGFLGQYSDQGDTVDGTSWPQDLPTVTSAGGTSLFPSQTARTYTETAWNGAGSGCTYDVAPAAGQPTSVSNHCDGGRAASDLSAVADPNTGVAVYDSYAPGSGVPYGFIVVGGTSVSSPFLAGMYARAAANKSVLGPNTIYKAPKSTINDITVGSNAPPNYCPSYDWDVQLCVSGKGWDGPTGVGSPKGLAPFASASAST